MKLLVGISTLVLSALIFYFVENLSFATSFITGILGGIAIILLINKPVNSMPSED